MSIFQLVSEYTPRGDQPAAIDALCEGIRQGVTDQVLLGVTGSGKTFTMAQTIARLGRPALIMAPNKTLAAQLYNEFKGLFPRNAVEYFVSYYDYYQPEAYLPHSDTYIEKDSAINDDIDKLRHAATHALLTRRDVIIIASVSCIYGLGSPEYYAKMIIPVECGQAVSMENIISRLVDVQYERNDYDLHRGAFRVRGDVLEIIPAYKHEQALRLEFFGDEIDGIYETDPLTGEILSRVQKTVIYPASHYVSDRDNLGRAMNDIREELRLRLEHFQRENMLVEAQRLEQKTQLDLEMMEELGYCNGIENYSLHLDGLEDWERRVTSNNDENHTVVVKHLTYEDFLKDYAVLSLRSVKDAERAEVLLDEKLKKLPGMLKPLEDAFERRKEYRRQVAEARMIVYPLIGLFCFYSLKPDLPKAP